MKKKLGFNQTSIRNLTSTELDSVGGGVITNNWKCSDIICPPTKYDECVTQNASCGGSCAASCAATCAASCNGSCNATCAASCNATCNATCGASCNIRCASRGMCSGNYKCPIEP